MYDPSLQSVVLAKLAKWNRLTESDLDAMLRPEDRLRLREDLHQDKAHRGLITMRVDADQTVLTITDKGRDWLSQSRPLSVIVRTGSSPTTRMVINPLCAMS